MKCIWQLQQKGSFLAHKDLFLYLNPSDLSLCDVSISIIFLFERIVFIQTVKIFSVICGQFETCLFFSFLHIIKLEKKIKESHTVHHFKTHCMCESNLRKGVRGILQQGCFLHYEGQASKWGVSSWTTSVGLASSLVPTVTPS